MPYTIGEGKTVVIALGGNALGNTPQEQLQLVKDTAKNIVGANEVGIHGILFENALQARESLAELGVRL